MARFLRSQPANPLFRVAFRNGLGTASIAVTGTIIGATEANIVSGGRTIILTVTGDSWVASGATFDAQRANIIAGLDSGSAEANGWDAVVKAGQTVGGVVRTSDSVVTITLDAFATYNITATETITVTVPATALLLNAAIVGSPTFNISAGVATIFRNRYASRARFKMAA